MQQDSRKTSVSKRCRKLRQFCNPIKPSSNQKTLHQQQSYITYIPRDGEEQDKTNKTFGHHQTPREHKFLHKNDDVCKSENTRRLPVPEYMYYPLTPRMYKGRIVTKRRVLPQYENEVYTEASDGIHELAETYRTAGGRQRRIRDMSPAELAVMQNEIKKNEKLTARTQRKVGKAAKKNIRKQITNNAPTKEDIRVFKQWQEYRHEEQEWYKNRAENAVQMTKNEMKIINRVNKKTRKEKRKQSIL